MLKYWYMQWGKQKNAGFTIVELLIVVVVIAILAAITIGAYNGIQNRAQVSALENTVSQVAKKIEILKTQSSTETYPATLAELGIPSPSGISINYYPNLAMNSYCAEATRGAVARSISSVQSSIVSGSCGVNGLAGWWKYNNDGSDSTGNGWDATVSSLSVATGQNGIANSAYAFDGMNSNSWLASSGGSISYPATFSFWIRPTAWNTQAASSFIAKRNGTSADLFIMYLTSSGTLAIDCGGSGNRFTSSYTPPLGQWSHIAVVCTPVSIAAYADGALISTVSRTVGSASNATNLQFGYDRTNYKYNGIMDDIRYFKRALTAAEIQALYEANAE